MTDEPEEDDDSLPLRELQRLAGGRCHSCGKGYTAREAVGSIALGLKNAPRCLPCAARQLGREETELGTQFQEYVQRRECYLKAWREAERMDDVSPASRDLASRDREGAESDTPLVSDAPGSPDDHWNAGDMGCGELVMELRIRLNKLPPGSVIQVTATDPAAPEDIPAWCRLTGHQLAAVDHPVYLIRRKGA